MEDEADTYFGLHFEPRYGDRSGHALPAQCLIEALEGLQRVVHLTAMMNEGREVRTRARVTRDIEQRFQLHCRPAKEGSFYQPTFVADKDQGFFSIEEAKSVTNLTRSVLKAVAQSDEGEFRKVVADSAFRTPIISSLEKLFGSKTSHYKLSIEDKNGSVFADSVSAHDCLEAFKQPSSELNTISIITGYFNKIDFKERKFSLHIPNSGRTINCLYEENVEATLLENARDLIQVVGTIEVDEAGNPHRITDVQEVHSVNTDDIDIIELLPEYLKPFELNNLRIRVELSDDKQTYFAQLEELEIDQAAYTRPDLISTLEAEIDFLWQNIAKEEDANLTPKAIALKEKLRKLFKEISE